jgi:hypothetical protein
LAHGAYVLSFREHCFAPFASVWVIAQTLIGQLSLSIPGLLFFLVHASPFLNNTVKDLQISSEPTEESHYDYIRFYRYCQLLFIVDTVFKCDNITISLTIIKPLIRVPEAQAEGVGMMR